MPPARPSSVIDISISLSGCKKKLKTDVLNQKFHCSSFFQVS